MGYQKFPFDAHPVRDKHGTILDNVRIIVDYHDPDHARYGALLEVKDYTVGEGDSLTIDPSNTSSTTWTETDSPSSSTEFDAIGSNDQTADNIASAINSVSGYQADAITGHDGNPFVSIHYASDFLTSTSVSDTDAWEFYTVNSTNGLIMTVRDDTGSFKPQPLYTDADGYFSFYAVGGTHVDILRSRAQQSFDDSRWEDLVVGYGEGIDSYFVSFDSSDLSSGILTVNHNLNVDYPSVVVYDDSDNVIQPDEITFVNSSSVDIDLSSYTINNAWQVRVLGGTFVAETIEDNIQDDDGDTTVKTEESSDEDVVRIYADGEEIVNFDNT